MIRQKECLFLVCVQVQRQVADAQMRFWLMLYGRRHALLLRMGEIWGKKTAVKGGIERQLSLCIFLGL
jgi:hypothetical protein